VALDAINHIYDSNDPSDFHFQWDRNSMFPFYPFNLLGVAIEAQTGVYKQRRTSMSPTRAIFNVLETINDQPSPGLTD